MTLSWEEVYQGTPAAAAQLMASDATFDGAIRAALLDIDPAVIDRDHASRVRKLFLEAAIALRDQVGSP